MGNLLDALREDRKKLLLVVAGLLAVGILGFVGYTMLSGMTTSLKLMKRRLSSSASSRS